MAAPAAGLSANIRFMAVASAVFPLTPVSTGCFFRWFLGFKRKFLQLAGTREVKIKT